MFELPFKTHRYFIEPISERRHLKFDILKREIKFANTLRNNKKRTIKTIFSLLEEDYGRINYNTVTNEKKWTLDLVKELINIRNGILSYPEKK